MRWDAIVRAQSLLRLALLAFQTNAVHRLSAFVIGEFFGDLSVVCESEMLIVPSQLVDARTDQVEKRIRVREFLIREPPISTLRLTRRGTQHIAAWQKGLCAPVEPNEAAANDPRLQIKPITGVSRFPE